MVITNKEKKISITMHLQFHFSLTKFILFPQLESDSLLISIDWFDWLMVILIYYLGTSIMILSIDEDIN